MTFCAGDPQKICHCVAVGKLPRQSPAHRHYRQAGAGSSMALLRICSGQKNYILCFEIRFSMIQYQYGNDAWGAGYQINIKIGRGAWRSALNPCLYGHDLMFDEQTDNPDNYIKEYVICDPEDLGLSSDSVKSNTYRPGGACGSAQ